GGTVVDRFCACRFGPPGQGRNPTPMRPPGPRPRRSLATTIPPPMSPDSLRLDTVRRMLARFSAGDAEGQLEHCADDVVYEAPYYAIERHGKAELAAMLASVQERFDEVSYVVVDDFPTVDPDVVIVY